MALHLSHLRACSVAHEPTSAHLYSMLLFKLIQVVAVGRLSDVEPMTMTFGVNKFLSGDRV